MPREPRVVIPGLLHHVTQRGNNREIVFRCDEDRRFYLDRLRTFSRQFRVDIFGFCLMRNHVHLIMRPAFDDGLASCLRRAHAEYAQWFNRRMSRIGHLWQNRYFSSVLEKTYVLTAMRYVDQNPVRAGIVDRADQFRWSSAEAHFKGRSDEFGLMSLEWREWREWPDWDDFLRQQEDAEATELLRDRTRQGRPLGGVEFTWEIREKRNPLTKYPEAARRG